MSVSPGDSSPLLPPRDAASLSERKEHSDSRWDGWTKAAEQQDTMRRRGMWVIASVIAVGSLAWLVFTSL